MKDEERAADGEEPEGEDGQHPEGEGEGQKHSGEEEAGAGQAVLSGAEGSVSSIGETIQTSGTFGGNNGAGSGTDASVKRQRGNRGGWKVQQQKRLREEREAYAQGAKGGWSSKRQHGGYEAPRDAEWQSWKREQRESAAQAWNQRLMDRGSGKSGGKGKNKEKKPEKEGFHQGYRRLTPLNGIMPQGLLAGRWSR